MPLKNNNNINLIKVPLRVNSGSKPQVFPRMPRLYLELLENKTKIKQDLINKEYVPSDDIVNTPIVSNKNDSAESYKDDSAESYKDDSETNNRKDDLDINFDDILDDDNSVESLDIQTKDTKNMSPASSFSELSIDENKNDKINADNYSNDSSDDLSERLKELLDDNSTDSGSEHKGSISSRKSTQSKYSRHRDMSGHSINPGAHGAAPTLAELEEKGGFVPKREFRDLNQSNYNEQEQENLKRELLFKFDLLKKSYPQFSVPDYSIHTDLDTLKKAYDDTVRRLSLDSSVESYKTYLIYGFMGAEFIFGNFLGFDMQGFTQQQIVSMSSYEKLLIELGEKSYVPSGSKWPVELRLLFMIIMNAAFFIISRMIMKKTGANLMGMINNMSTTSNSTNSTTPNVQPKKRKMKGPNLDLGDIPDL